MKFVHALSFLVTALSAASAEGNLRGKSTPETKLLARVEVAPDASIDMLLVEDRFFMIKGKASNKANPE